MPPSGGLVCLCTTIHQCRSTVLLFNATFGPWLDYLAITKYSCLFGSLCRKLLQWNKRNQFRLAVMLFGYPYQFIQFSFFEKKNFLGLSQPCLKKFFRTIRAPNQNSWRRLIWHLLATLLAGVPCAFRYIYDFRSFSCPKPFRAVHNKQIPVEAEYDNNKCNSNNLL